MRQFNNYSLLTRVSEDPVSGASLNKAYLIQDADLHFEYIVPRRQCNHNDCQYILFMLTKDKLSAVSGLYHKVKAMAASCAKARRELFINMKSIPSEYINLRSDSGVHPILVLING